MGCGTPRTPTHKGGMTMNQSLKQPLNESLNEPLDHPLLSVRGLRTHFFGDEGTVRAVDGISLDIMPGQTVGIVGESGCGKSVTARSILRIVDKPGRIVDGEI